VPDGPAGEGPEEEAVFNEVKVLTEQVVHALPFKQRAAFTLRKLHDADYDTIGQSLAAPRERPRPCLPGAEEDPPPPRRPPAHGEPR